MSSRRPLKKSRRLGRPLAPVELTPAERRTLSSWSRQTADTPPAVAWRARIILMAGEGAPSVAIAERLRTSPQTVCKWRGRFVAQRLAGLWTRREAHALPG